MFCGLLNLSITSCAGSGNHPACRACLGTNVPTPKILKPPSIDQKCKSKKRCRCGRFFLMNSNRQIYCRKCQRREYRKGGRCREHRPQEAKSERGLANRAHVLYIGRNPFNLNEKSTLAWQIKPGSNGRGTWPISFMASGTLFPGEIQSTRQGTDPRFPFIECKLRKKHTDISLWDETKALADKERKVPVVVLCEKNRPGFWIMVHSEDFLKI